MSNALILSGATLAYSSDSGVTYTTIAEVTSVNFQVSVDSVNATSISSPSYTEEYIPGMKKLDKLSMNIHYSKTQINTIYPIFTNRTTYYWKITFSDSGNFVGTGFGTNFKINGTGADAIVDTDVEVQLQTAPVFATS
jgi:predicted secreted protein